MTIGRTLRWIAWIGLVVAAVLQIGRTTVVTDVTSFLPGPADADQRLMADQLRDGLSTRILIVGLRLPDDVAAQPAALEDASRRLRERLAADPAFAWVSNGDLSGHERERERLFDARYLLSPGVTAQAFSTAGLAGAFERLETALASAQGVALRPIARADPTLEVLRFADAVSGVAARQADGLWLSGDKRTALLVLETTARGHDIDGVRAAIERVRTTAADVLATWPPGLAAPAVDFAGAAWFNVRAHDALGRDAEHLSLLAIVLIGALLWRATRSPRLLGLAVIPVATGALCGFAAVGFTAGSIHAITLAFGMTLIGEAVDYAIYTYVQREPGGRHPPGFWRALGLALLTSLIGFTPMLFSGFQGLRQLALFSIVGLVVAAACARWLLPDLMPAPVAAPAPADDRPAPAHGALPALLRAMRRLRWPLVVATLALAAMLVAQRDRLWLDSLDSLSASAPQDTVRDQRWRDALGMPDLRTLVTVRGADRDEALARAQAVAGVLDRLVQEGRLRGYDSPTALLPPAPLQAARRAALPEPTVLRERVDAALAGRNLRAAAFEPFFAAVEAARTGPAIDVDHYRGTALGHWLDARLVASDDGVAALILLQGATSRAEVDRALRSAGLPGVATIDLGADVAALVAGYRAQATRTALLGLAGIVAVLALQLRRPRPIAAMTATLVATVVVSAALLTLLSGHLTVFNLVALLLVAGVASNYALFFATLPAEPGLRRRTSLSVLLAGASTFLAFAMLALASAPVLAMIGLTVAIGALVGLVAAMAFAPTPPSA